MTTFDIAVIGGGIVGASLAAGLAARKHRVVLFDEGDVALRAARGNLGNVWIQGKGLQFPAYADLTRIAASKWPTFSADLEEETGVKVFYRRTGAIVPFFDLAAAQERARALAELEEHTTVKSPFELIDNQSIRELIPEIGPEVAAATYSAADGSVNPLYLLRALLKSYQLRSGTYLPGHAVAEIHPNGSDFEIVTARGRWTAHKVILAAGLGNPRLAADLGLDARVFPQRGQLLVTERLKPFLNCQIMDIRQTNEGSIVFGESKEEVGEDDRTTSEILEITARRAARTLPLLRTVRIVRSWAALRVMSPDGFPIYQQSEQFPNAFLATVHSGITLAPYHASELADIVAAGNLPAHPLIKKFSPARFHVH